MLKTVPFYELSLIASIKCLLLKCLLQYFRYIFSEKGRELEGSFVKTFFLMSFGEPDAYVVNAFHAAFLHAMG